MLRLALALALAITPSARSAGAPPLPAPAPPPARHADPAANTVHVATFAIDGMVTSNCPVLVKLAVGKVPGVRRVDASLETKSAEVEFDPGKTSTDAILAVIRDQVGFQARLVDVRKNWRAAGCTAPTMALASFAVEPAGDACAD